MQKNRIQEIYRKRAATYDLELRFLRFVGFWEGRYRRAAVEALKLMSGDTVFDLGCGTGRNFSYIREAIGSNGHLTGVDLTSEMLEKARSRVIRHAWTNVELAEADASKFSSPFEADGIISTFVLSTVPEPDKVIERAMHLLRPGGRFVILDVKEPALWPSWCFKPSVSVFIKPYGTLYEHFRQKPWESMKRHFKHVSMQEFYLGAIYMAVGEK
jgi:demethylmenaquinone methyltransferase/2-methoxy-6-polyprenyl-1,4-benzoquinol methylase